MSGIEVGSLFEEQKVFDVVVWGRPETRNSLSSIRQLLIDTPAGGHVRLEDVAEVRIAPNQTIINREAVSRYVDVGASVSGRDREAVLGDVEGALEGMAFPLEYHAEVLAADTQPVGSLDLYRGRCGDRDLPPPASVFRKLALGDAGFR